MNKQQQHLKELGRWSPSLPSTDQKVSRHQYSPHYGTNVLLSRTNVYSPRLWSAYVDFRYFQMLPVALFSVFTLLNLELSLFFPCRHQDFYLEPPPQKKATMTFLDSIVAVSAGVWHTLQLVPVEQTLALFKRVEHDVLLIHKVRNQVRKMNDVIKYNKFQAFLQTVFCFPATLACKLRYIHTNSRLSDRLPTFLNLTRSGSDSPDWLLYVVPPLIKDSSGSNVYWGLQPKWLRVGPLGVSGTPSSQTL